MERHVVNTVGGSIDYDRLNLESLRFKAQDAWELVQTRYNDLEKAWGKGVSGLAKEFVDSMVSCDWNTLSGLQMAAFMEFILSKLVGEKP